MHAYLAQDHSNMWSLKQLADVVERSVLNVVDGYDASTELPSGNVDIRQSMRFSITVPTAQDTEFINMKATPMGVVPSVLQAPPINTAIPAMPRPRAAMRRAVSASPRMGTARSEAQRGMVKATKAARG